MTFEKYAWPVITRERPIGHNFCGPLVTSCALLLLLPFPNEVRQGLAALGDDAGLLRGLLLALKELDRPGFLLQPLAMTLVGVKPEPVRVRQTLEGTAEQGSHLLELQGLLILHAAQRLLVLQGQVAGLEEDPEV